MKKFLFFCFSIAVIMFVYSYREEIVKYFFELAYPKEEVNFDYRNSYYLKYRYKYYKELDEFKIENKEDISNIYYTITNNGYDNFKFYCPDEYKDCLEDVKSLVFDQKQLSVINGFVHPYSNN